MARSIALSNDFADTYSPPAVPAPVRATWRRLIDWLSRSQQRSVEHEIESYLAQRGFDHFTDSIERDIEYRFLARQPVEF